MIPFDWTLAAIIAGFCLGCAGMAISMAAGRWGDDDLICPTCRRDRHAGECADDWMCVGCATRIRTKEPAALGAVCCPGCGMTLLRPTAEVVGGEQARGC